MSSSQDPPSSPPEHVVIAGAGVIGTCTAYYLAKNYRIRTTLVDPTGRIAPAASGKAGGFLAMDWNDYSTTGPLTRRSFQLHQEIADTLGAEKIQYRRLSCAAISVDSSGPTAKPKGKKLDGIEWAQPGQDEQKNPIVGMRTLGDENTIAQVHPHKLCCELWKETQTLVDGCQLLKASVTGTKRGDDGSLSEVLLSNGESIPATKVLYACGPWTADIMYGIKYHSLLLPTDRVLSQCVFFSGCGDPEVYVRPDKTAYCTGFPDAPVSVTEMPGDEAIDKDKIESIATAVRKASSGSSTGSPLAQDHTHEQACYLPTTNDGIPVMGQLSEEIAKSRGCYIATGHTCWGILLGPASGEAMADLIATGKSEHVDLDPFSPSRYNQIGLVPTRAN